MIVRLSAILLLGLLLTPRLSFGATTATVQNFDPAVDKSSYFTLRSSRTLGRWQWHSGFYLNYGRRPLLRGTSVITDDLLMGDLLFSVGLFRWLDVGVDFPIAFYNDSANLVALPTSTAVPVTRNASAGLGDLRLETKFRLLDIDRYAVGIALVPFISFPTGDGNHFVGNDTFAGGVRALLDFKILDRAEIGFNLGYWMRKNFNFPGTATADEVETQRDDSYLVGIGLVIKTVEWLDLIGEINSQILVKDPFGREIETPAEAGGGLRMRVPSLPGLQFNLGGSSGITFGFGSPSYRIIGGLAYTSPSREERSKKREEPEPVFVPKPAPVEEPLVRMTVELTHEKIEINRKVHFAYESNEIRPVSFPILDAVAKVLNENQFVRKVEIQGHTDNKGESDFNLHLSQRRAESVRRYLIQRGVQPERLTAKGYGENQPIDTDETDLGRARNRRVEFFILEQDEPRKILRPIPAGEGSVAP